MERGPGVAAALYASGKISETTPIKTIVSRGGRPDLISSIFNCDKKVIENIKNIPLLFIIGQKDKLVLELTKTFIKNNKLTNNSKIEIIKDASHLFEEPEFRKSRRCCRKMVYSTFTKINFKEKEIGLFNNFSSRRIHVQIVALYLRLLLIHLQ